MHAACRMPRQFYPFLYVSLPMPHALASRAGIEPAISNLKSRTKPLRNQVTSPRNILSHAVSPHLHLTTSKVMVIVWRLRGNIIRTVLYIANVLFLQWAQLTETVHTALLGLEFVFVFFGLHDLSLCSCVFCFTLVS